MKKMRLFFITLALFVGTNALFSFAHGAAYEFRRIDWPGEGFETYLQGINDSGQIVGFADPGNIIKRFGFVYQSNVFTKIMYPDSVVTSLYAINDSGQILGSYGKWVPGGAEMGNFLLKNGTFNKMEIYGYSTGLQAINNSGQIVGWYFEENEPCNAFLFHNGVYSNINPPDATGGFALGINDSGEIVGWYTAGGHGHGFYFNDGGYSIIDYPGAESTALTGINDSGQIVGDCWLNGSRHGFLFENGVFTTIDFPGVDRTYLLDINDSGQIIGRWSMNCGPNQGGFVADPVPIPSAVLLLGFGLIGLLVLRKYFRKA